ncbi:DUF523 domain-containing protein [Proteiniclasticum sp.]|uniref:DUF523 domain-containing protein n=1 Tax=Proteiniclasticum sp. TaxID=2053595 RepID=UPI002899C4B9|nr:DUF523 domain-containing protein [Proteiniclasticum sp.]
MKEKILVSACLLGEKLRYDGGGYDLPEIQRLKEKYELIPMCPEVLGGLSVPRDPAEIKDGFILTVNGNDVTKNFEDGAQITLKYCLQNGITKAVLKARSPSCGKDIIYDGTHTKKLIEGHGVTCALLLENDIEVYTESEIGGL